MSHVATMKTVIYDLSCLEKACADLGLKFVWDQHTHRWYGRWMNDYSESDAAYLNGVTPDMYGKCLHAITIPGNKTCYEVGVVKNPQGDGYLLLFDFWSGGLGMGEKVGGKDMGKLLAHYAKYVQIQEAQAQGYGVSEKVDEYGNIELTFEDYTYA